MSTRCECEHQDHFDDAGFLHEYRALAETEDVHTTHGKFPLCNSCRNAEHMPARSEPEWCEILRNYVAQYISDAKEHEDNDVFWEEDLLARFEDFESYLHNSPYREGEAE